MTLRFTPQQIDTAIDLKHRYRSCGPKKIIAKLKALYPNQTLTSTTRIYEIFKDHHLVTSNSVKARIPAEAPLGSFTGCNEKWAVDLKGWFLTRDGYRCESLTITDCFSRNLIRCVHLKKHMVEHVRPVFAEAIKRIWAS